MHNKHIPTCLGTTILVVIAITAGVFVWTYEKNQGPLAITPTQLPQQIKGSDTATQKFPKMNQTEKDRLAEISRLTINSIFSEPLTEWKSYSSEKYKYSFKYPSGLNQGTACMDTTDCYYVSLQHENNALIAIRVALFDTPENAKSTTGYDKNDLQRLKENKVSSAYVFDLYTYYKNNKFDLKKYINELYSLNRDWPETQLGDITELFIDNEQAYKFNVTSKGKIEGVGYYGLNDRPQEHIYVVTSHNGKLYDFWINYDKGDNGDRYLNEIISTFRFSNS